MGRRAKRGRCPNRRALRRDPERVALLNFVQQVRDAVHLQRLDDHCAVRGDRWAAFSLVDVEVAIWQRLLVAVEVQPTSSARLTVGLPEFPSIVSTVYAKFSGVARFSVWRAHDIGEVRAEIESVLIALPPARVPGVQAVSSRIRHRWCGSYVSR